MGNTFYIHYKFLEYRKVYCSKVEILKQTNHVIVFKVMGTTKEVLLRKYLFRKTNDWKFLKCNFRMTRHSKDNELLLSNIQKAIDAYLKQQKII